MIKFNLFAPVFFITYLFVLSYAIPVKDISSTSIGISKIHTFPSTESFVVAVQHVDDLVNDDGDLLAERVSAVIINFDLRDEQLLMNNVPIPLGINSIQVIEAQVIPENKNVHKYENNFDSGLITVEIKTAAEFLSTVGKDGSLRRIKISIRIIEVDGTKVNQVEIIKKAFVFKSLETADNTQNSEISTMYLKSHSCSMISYFRRWWHSSFWLTNVAIVILFLIFFGIVFMIIRDGIEDIIALFFPQNPYQIVCQDDDDDYYDGRVEKNIFPTDEEKQALMKQNTEKN